MSQKLIAAVARTARLKILNLIKHTQGLSVQELADELGMSYMGVKELCVDLQRRGLLDVRRQPRPAGSTGRPRLLYRLTERAHELFPTASNPLTMGLLKGATKLYGPAGAEKLLMLVWQQKAVALGAKVKGAELPERVASVAQIREEEGHMASVEQRSDGRLRIVEHHCPFLDVLREYPIVVRIEVDLFQQLLGAPIERHEEHAGGLYRTEFVIG